jgi:hypothetical protein
LSTFAEMRLACTSDAGSRPRRSQAAVISAGVLREVAPLPPATWMPSSPSVPRSPSFSAPHTVVVRPLECQSKPSTQPKAWNQYGSASRRSTSSRPNSEARNSTISRASGTMRWNSHGGAWPVWSGSWATPVRDTPRL